MLGKEARALIKENWENYYKSLNDKNKVEPTVEEIRRSDYELAERIGPSIYPNTKVETKSFNGVNVDVMTPSEIKGKTVVMYIHGGAWMFGSAMNARLTASYFTEEEGLIALCPDYRLSPEHRFDALLDDCYNAYLKAVELYGAENILLTGSSAGGNLSLALMQKLKDNGVAYPACVFLYSPATYMGEKDSNYALAKNDIILRGFSDKNLMENFGYTEEEYLNKYMSPLNGDYDGFPPTYISCGSEERLLDDSFMLFKKMKRAGVKAVLSVRAGIWHSYIECQHFIPEAREELKNMMSFLNDVLNGDIIV